MKTACIIIHYGDVSVTLNCLTSLLQSTKGMLILLVCNTSYEESARVYAALCARFSHACIYKNAPGAVKQDADRADTGSTKASIILLEQGSNAGYAAACNAGLRACTRFPFLQYAWILNNDTQVATDTLSHLEDCLANSPQSIIGTAVYTMSNPQQLELVLGCRFSPWTSICTPCHDAHAVFPQVDYVYGASMAFPLALVQSIGLWDEHFFLYYEEHDFCVRAKKAGYAFVWCTKAKVWHHGGQSAKSRVSSIADEKTRVSRQFSHYHENRSTFLFLKKHTPWALPTALIIRTLTKLVLLPLRGQSVLLRGYFQGVYDALRTKI